MATFKEITSQDIKTSRSSLSQLVDIIQQDISGSSSRRHYQNFVTGGRGPGVTSSMFQTVYDQDFTLQTANAMFDVTMGLFASGSTVINAQSGIDSTGKLLFPSSTLMMREKVDIYKEFAQLLLGDSESQFVAPADSTQTGDKVNEALFVCFKRLFARDKIKRETFALRFLQQAQTLASDVPNLNQNVTGSTELSNGTYVYTDVGSSNNRNVLVGGEIGSIVDSSDTTRAVGLMFYDRGIAVLDMAKIMSGNQRVSGTIDALNDNTLGDMLPGMTILGGVHGGNPNAKFIPDLLVSGSIDDVLDHVCAVRFGTGSSTSMTFQNVTNINSTLVFCRANADEFNYSSNPTYRDADGRIVVIEPGSEDTQTSFVFATGIGLYDANDTLLAIAKISRPLEKDASRDVTLRIRLDY